MVLCDTNYLINYIYLHKKLMVIKLYYANTAIIDEDKTGAGTVLKLELVINQIICLRPAAGKIIIIKTGFITPSIKKRTVKMKQFIATALVALTGMVAQAQVKEARTAKPITALEVTDGITVVYTQGTTALLSAEAANRETLNNVVTEYNKGTLKVYLKPAEETTMHLAEGVVVYVSGNATWFEAQKGAIITLKETVTATDVAISLKSGAVCSGLVNATNSCHITAKGGAGYRGVVTAGTFKADALGGAYIKASGRAESVNITCKGGSVHAGKLLCGKATVLASNAAAVSVYAGDYVSANADATSTVSYFGEPKKAVTGANSYKIVRETEKLTLN